MSNAEPAIDDLDWDLDPSSSRSGVMPATTVRPDFDVAAFARESEERMAVAAFIPSISAPRSTPTIRAPGGVPVVTTLAPSAALRALLRRDEPR